MAQVLWLGERAYSDFRFNNRRIKRALRDETGNPVTNDRDAKVALGKMIQLVHSAGAGLAADQYPWRLFKERLLENNERGKAYNGLRRDKVAFTILERFFLKEYGRPLASTEDVTRDVLGQLLEARRKEGRTASTRMREIGSLKAALRWAQKCTPPLRSVEDWRLVKLPKVGKRRPHHHSRAELVQLLKSLPAGPYLTAAWLGARAGLRRGELVHLQPGDLKLERGLVAIVGKACSLCRECRDAGGRWQPKDVDEREIPLLDDLRAYLTPLMPLLRRRRWVLGDDKARPALQELSKDFARLTRKAGLSGGVQTLRHTFGSHMADDGVPIRVLQGWMGHENLTTTEQYTSVGKSDVDHAKKARPLDLS